MKVLITILLSLLVYVSIDAKCAITGFEIYPKKETIASNSVIILNGYWRDAEVVELLNEKYPVFLQSSTKRIAVEILKLNHGYNVIQAVLKPKDSLEVEESFVLKIENLTAEQQRRLHAPRNASPGSNSGWRAIPPQPIPILKQIENFSYESWHCVQYGCGPAKGLNLQLDHVYPPDVFFEIEVEDLETNEISSFIQKSMRSDILMIGHGMCNGNFNIKGESKYLIRLRAMRPASYAYGEWSEYKRFETPKVVYIY